MITAIDPQSLRTQSNQRNRSNLSLDGGDNFEAAMIATAGVAGTVVGLEKGYQPAAVTHAAITGVSGVPGAFGANASSAPYYGGVSTASTPFSSGGYAYGGASFGGGYAGTGASTGTGMTTPIGGTGGYSIQDNQEKAALFQQMNDANWEMLTAQVTVNNISRDYQARSNILKTKSDTELNAVRNMRA